MLGALLFIALGLGLYAAAPWILPVRIVEGPLVQQAGAGSAIVVWYTSRPARCELSYTPDANERFAEITTDDRRHSALLTDLQPGLEHPYRITVGERTLAQAALKPVKTAADPFHFIVFGDSGMASTAQYLLATQMAALDPDFLLHTGDLVYSRGERAAFDDRFFKPYGRMLRRASFWPCVGNHDVAEPGFGGAYREVFELPPNGPEGLPAEHDYWFDYAAARVAVIDSNHSEAELAGQVAPWLIQVMSASGALWKFVALHHPPYTAGRYEPDQRIIRALVPAFESAGVDIVFAGHDHHYERTQPLLGGQIAAVGSGVVYIVTGAGGARIYEALPPAQRPAYVAALNDQTHGFTHVEIDGAALRVRQIALGGDVLDDWELRKTGADEAPP